MLGFHTDGVRLFGASEQLIQQLRERKIPLVRQITGNTIVFAINDTEVIQKRLYAVSFLTPQAPWFVCTVGDVPRFAPHVLRFAAEEDLLEFITAIYYATAEFLHLDFEMEDLKRRLSRLPQALIRSCPQEAFSSLPKEAESVVFYFGQGGFAETDRLFHHLTKECALDTEHLLLTGSFASPHSFLYGFYLQA